MTDALTRAAQRIDQKLLLGADAASNQDQLRIEDMHQPGQTLCDLIDPILQQSQYPHIPCFGRSKIARPSQSDGSRGDALRTSAVVAA